MLGARLYKFDMCVTSRYFVANPWFAETLSGGGTGCEIGSLDEGDVVGFSMTVPNWANAVGVRSSIGIRMDGAGIDVGILAVLRRQVWRPRIANMGKWTFNRGSARLAKSR